jgi:hypothetical protein
VHEPSWTAHSNSARAKQDVWRTQKGILLSWSYTVVPDGEHPRACRSAAGAAIVRCHARPFDTSPLPGILTTADSVAFSPCCSMRSKAAAQESRPSSRMLTAKANNAPQHRR